MKKVKFKVRRNLSQKGKRQSFYVQTRYGKFSRKITLPVTYATGSFITGDYKSKVLEFKTREEAVVAVGRLHKKINRPLPGGNMSTLDWIQREAARIAQTHE